MSEEIAPYVLNDEQCEKFKRLAEYSQRHTCTLEQAIEALEREDRISPWVEKAVAFYLDATGSAVGKT